MTLYYSPILGFEGYVIIPTHSYSKKRRAVKLAGHLLSHTTQFCANIEYNRRNSHCNKKRYELI